MALAEPPSVEAFFEPVKFRALALSPDGKNLAALARINAVPDARNLLVTKVNSRRWRALTGYDDEFVRSVAWLSNDRLLLTVSGDDGAPDLVNPGLSFFFTISRDGTDGFPLRIGSLIDSLPSDDQHILMAIPGERSAFSDVYRMDVLRGHQKKIEDNSFYVDRWITDNKGLVRAAIDVKSAIDRLYRLLYRETVDADWQPVLDFELGHLHVYGFDADNRHIWLAARSDRDTFALYRFDPKSARLGDPVFADPEFDVHSGRTRMRGLVRDTDGSPLFLQYMTERPRIVYFNQNWADRQAQVDMALTETVNTFVDWDEHQQRFLVLATSDRIRGDYYLYDDEARELRFLLSQSDKLDAEQMAEMRPVTFKARDDLTIHGYLTMPPARDGRPVRLVVYPHDGPHGVRDEWGFDPEVQFLASRGYGVLQVNYRGSSGYGKHFEQLGYKRWGLEMQDDLADAVLWAIDEGWADPQRICIYGVGYGGYAVMVGVTQTPSLYRCGIDYGGIVDLTKMYRQKAADHGTAGRRLRGRAWAHMALGKPRDDRQRFHDTSPINFVSKITAPLFIIHGGLDAEVHIEQYQSLVWHLFWRGKDYETMTERHEGHTFLADDARFELHERIEKFLAAHL